MMAGVPVICAYDAPDTLIKQYNCGYQCDPGNPHEVANRIISLSEMSKQELREMGLRGKEAIIRNYTYAKLAAQFMNVMTDDE